MPLAFLKENALHVPSGGRLCASAAAISFANIHRRHMTKGQRAMAVAMIYPEKQQGKKGTSSISKEVVSGGFLSMARLVLAHSRPLADAVLNGLTSLDAAH